MLARPRTGSKRARARVAISTAASRRVSAVTPRGNTTSWLSSAERANLGPHVHSPPPFPMVYNVYTVYNSHILATMGRRVCPWRCPPASSKRGVWS